MKVNYREENIISGTSGNKRKTTGGDLHWSNWEEIKERYENHLLSFKYEKCKNNTTLSEYIWDIKMQKTPLVELYIIKKYAEKQRKKLQSMDGRENTNYRI